jgi:Ran GTPase-activating protein (RanGAP) involved in mRNA processing and transport
MDSRLNGKFVTPKNISLSNTLVFLFNYSLHSLVTLSIRDYSFDEDSLINLMNIIEYTNNLTNLDISSNFLGDEKIRKISESLRINKTIKSLNIAYNNIGNNGAFYLGDFLLKNNFIERLFVSGNNLSGLGLQNLMKILSNHKSIRHLDISNNKLKDADIMEISNFITKNLRFEGLDISYNYLDMNTLNQIGLSFKENRTLKLFKGTNLGLNVESTPYLLQHLNDTNIEEIYLDNNNIGETGGILISNVIKYNKKLKLVSLKNCNLDPVALTCFCHSFELNKNFKNLYLESNKFDFDSIEYLCNTIADKDTIVSLSKSYIEKQIFQRIAGIHNIILN